MQQFRHLLPILPMFLATTGCWSESVLGQGASGLISQAEADFFTMTGLGAQFEAIDSNGQERLASEVRILSDWLLRDRPDRERLHVVTIEYMVASHTEPEISADVSTLSKGGGHEGPLALAIRIPWNNRYTRISFRLIAVRKQPATTRKVVVVNRIFSNESGEWIEQGRATSKEAPRGKAVNGEAGNEKEDSTRAPKKKSNRPREEKETDE